MTDASKTADILAAWQLIEEHGLRLMQDEISWLCGDGCIGARGKNHIAAVRAWAESAGVPWPAVKVVPMWAAIKEDAIHSLHSDRAAADVQAWWFSGAVVPCDIVICESEGV